MWRSKDNIQEPVLSIHHVVSCDQTQVVRLYRKCLDSLMRCRWPLHSFQETPVAGNKCVAINFSVVMGGGDG